jgi:hypothetical protein
MRSPEAPCPPGQVESDELVDTVLAHQLCLHGWATLPVVAALADGVVPLATLARCERQAAAPICRWA